MKECELCHFDLVGETRYELCYIHHGETRHRYFFCTRCFSKSFILRNISFRECICHHRVVHSEDHILIAITRDNLPFIKENKQGQDIYRYIMHKKCFEKYFIPAQDGSYPPK